MTLLYSQITFILVLMSSLRSVHLLFWTFAAHASFIKTYFS